MEDLRKNNYVEFQGEYTGSSCEQSLMKGKASGDYEQEKPRDKNARMLETSNKL